MNTSIFSNYAQVTRGVRRCVCVHVRKQGEQNSDEVNCQEAVFDGFRVTISYKPTPHAHLLLSIFFIVNGLKPVQIYANHIKPTKVFIGEIL